jgi:hypothetical protein
MNAEPGASRHTSEDLEIMRRWAFDARYRYHQPARTDFEIMAARTRAAARGASPLEVQRNVERLRTYDADGVPADHLPNE